MSNNKGGIRMRKLILDIEEGSGGWEKKRGSGYRVERSTGVGVEHAGPAWDRLPRKEERQWEIQRTVRQRI